MTRVLGIVLAATLAVPACGSDVETTSSTTVDRAIGGTTTTGPASSGPDTTGWPVLPSDGVEIVDFEFVPRELVVSRGETVTWQNQDPYAHWVVSTAADVLDSGELSQAQTYSKTFSQAGTFNYYCNIHNYMKASVTVQ